ncbi:MAG: GyrI-like domain-containing protein [Bacteroidales bacterium]|jgi:predicted transcriptional regulator YdeE|nr:GyrI-like domain-containing protein [Bacteroidales bacterium]MDY0086707.1 GyrI-like domain-containing protein [Bacteroidales bacterium]HOI31594.1 GyrI-like domain-containing protein [Bacteroidales bacterium]
MIKEVKESFKLTGLKLDGKTTNQNMQSAKDCGSLWQKFETNKIFDRIKGKLSNEIYAVYYEYEKDENSPFSYFIGCKTSAGYNPPEGLSELIIPAQKYERFLAKGPMTACITEAWKNIWASDLNRKFGFDFEIYDERSHDWNNAEVAIFISIAEEE